MTAGDARALLRRVDRNFRTWRTRKDCRFVFGPVASAIARLDRRGASVADRSLLATAYCFIGDIFDLISAPRAAARAYRAAIRLEPKHPYAWAELGGVLDDIGRYRSAARALDTAVRLGDDSWWTGFRRQGALESTRDEHPPFCENGRVGGRPPPSWEACELLARNRPRAALELLRGKRHPYLVQLRARAFGALEDVQGFLGEWEAMRASRGDVEIEIADWFFDPGGMWDMPRFWRAQWAIRRRSAPDFGPMHSSMWDLLPEPRKAKRGSHAARRRHLRRHTRMLRYHLARTEKDAEAARRLARRYPDWPEAVALARHLT